MSLLGLIKCIIIIANFGVCYYYGGAIPFEKQWPLYEALRNTSAIVFGVSGAWLAIVYPESLAKLVKKEASDESIDRLVSPIILSTVILIILLFVGIAAPIASQLISNIKYIRIGRGLSYGLLSVLTLVQIWTLILTLLPAGQAQQNARKALAQGKYRRATTSKHQKPKK